jgi:class 3 adenylate cyclase
VLRKSVIEAGGVEIDPARRRVKQGGVVVPLTAKEFALLEFLAHRAGEVVDRFDILEHCWDHAYEPESNVVDVHVRGLRRKLGDGVVETVRGAGYRVPESGPDAAPAAAPGQVPTGTVTVVFTDIVDSTATTERVGDRRWLELLAEHNALVRAHLAEHGGYEVKSTGDGFMLAFGSARSALDCAIGIQRGLATRREEHPDEPLAVRIGLHTGEPIWGERDFHGRGVALAARIGSKAEADEILCSTLTRELTESLGDFTFEGHRDVKLKGLSGRHRVHVVSWRP